MNILLDGRPYSNGDLASALEDILFDDPSFDESRLSYAKEFLAEQAKARVLDFAENARSQAIGKTGAGHSASLMTKGALAVLTIARTNTKLFDSEIGPAITAAFEAEAERRGQDETADDLMVASAKKMLGALMVHGLVEGRVKSLNEKIETTSADELDGLLLMNQAEAQAELRGILSTE